MAKKAKKETLDDEQGSALDHLHGVQIATETVMVIITVCIFTINLGSIWLSYRIIDFLVLAISCFMLLICGTLLTSWANELSKLGEPLESAVMEVRLKRWLTVTWWWVPVFILVVAGLGNTSSGASDIAKYLIIGAVVLGFCVSVIYDLVIIQSLWRRFNRGDRKLVRPITYATLAGIMVLVAIFGSYTTTTSLEYASITNSDSNLELGQSEVRQPGKAGQKQTVHNLIFGFGTSATQADPVNEIIAKGTRRYQYMYCSNGSYRYYTADQFKDPKVGFTHKSPDYCAKNNEGTETTVADVPPAKTQTTYVPTYVSPHITTHCYSSLYGSDINCYSY